MESDFSLIKPSRKTTKKSVANEPSSTPTRKYSLEDFNKFRQTMKIQIPQSIIDKIKIIYNETMKSKTEYMNSRMKAYDKPSYNNQTSYASDTAINRTSFNTSATATKKRKNRTHELSDEDWETMRNFKITQKDKKIGIEKKYDELRSLLNKLTDNTYEEIKSDIVNTIKTHVGEETGHTYYDFAVIIGFIFEIVKSNAFYSKLYANFIYDLFQMDASFVNWFQVNFSSLISSLYGVELHKNDIRIGNAEKDYDDFCEINKENEQRRNLAVFFCDMKHRNGEYFVKNEKMYDDAEYVVKYYELFLNYGENDEEQEQCAEACELFCVLYKNLLMTPDVDEKLVDRVRQLEPELCANLRTITKLKRSELKQDYPGITSKTLFKLMDVDLKII